MTTHAETCEEALLVLSTTKGNNPSIFVYFYVCNNNSMMMTNETKRYNYCMHTAFVHFLLYLLSPTCCHFTDMKTLYREGN